MEIIFAIGDIVTNMIILGTACTVVVAQTLKIVFMSVKLRKLDFSYAFSMSGMPSGHSSGVSSLATLVGLYSGFSSAIFAVAACIAVVIMYDAMGVRQQAGKHAQMLNHLLDKLTVYNSEEEDSRHYLKVRLGHTPVEVFAGCVTGVSCALLFWFLSGQ